jgi:hypothetical protein
MNPDLSVFPILQPERRAWRATIAVIAAAAKPRAESQGNPEILRYRRTISRKHKAATEIENIRESGASGPKREREKDRSHGEAAGTSKE